MTLPRIQYAVPRTLQVWLKITKAICLLAANDEVERLRKRKQAEEEEEASVREIVEEVVGKIRRELRKAAFDPNEPRVPAGNPDGGQWTSDGGSTPSATPESDGISGRQYATNDSPGIGHNQGPPLKEPPEIPPEQPATKQAINTFLKATAYWLAEAALAGEPAGDFILALQAADWLSNYLPYIYAYLDQPKTLANVCCPRWLSAEHDRRSGESCAYLDLRALGDQRMVFDAE